MDIVLNTLFDNSHLPRVQYPGFADDFSAADGTLDYTEDGKTWQRISATGSGTAAWVRSSGEAMLTTPSPSSFALADALVPDGVFTTTIGAVGSGYGATILRYVDVDNHIYLAYAGSGSKYQLLKRVAGSTTGLFATAVTATDGDVIAVTLDGQDISVTRNGSALGSPVTVSNFATATLFGFSASSADYTASWESVEFVEAGS